MWQADIQNLKALHHNDFEHLPATLISEQISDHTYIPIIQSLIIFLPGFFLFLCLFSGEAFALW